MQLHNFIYLDTEHLTSLWAQINNGNLTSYIEEFSHQSDKADKNSHTSGNTGAEANIGVLKGTLNTGNNELSTIVSDTEIFKSALTTVIHDDAFNKVLDYLESEKLIIEDSMEQKEHPSLKVGDYIKVSISPRILDLNYFSQFSATFLQALGLIIEDSESVDGRIKESDLFKDPQDFFAVMRNFCPSEIILQSGRYISYLEPEFMRDKVSCLNFKYGDKFVLVGRITKKGRPKIKLDMPKDTMLFIMEQMKELTKTILTQVGFEFDGHTLTVSPIAVYPV